MNSEYHRRAAWEEHISPLMKEKIKVYRCFALHGGVFCTSQTDDLKNIPVDTMILVVEMTVDEFLRTNTNSPEANKFFSR